MDSNTTCVCDSTISLNTAHLRGVNRFKEITRYIIKNYNYIDNSNITTAATVLEPRILIHHISANSESNDSGDDEISEEEEQTVKLALNRPRRHHHHHHRHRPLSHHASSSSSSNSSTPVHRGTSTGTASQESSSVPQSPSSTHQTDESSSSPTRRRASKSRWSPASLKHALRSLSLNALFLPTESNKEKKSKKRNERILRSPVAYTYVKGLSGLPTQRVPLRQTGGRGYLYPVHNYSCYPPTAELCCLQRAAALSALCLDR